MDGLHDIEVTAGFQGPTVTVDGQALDGVQAVAVQAAPGNVPQVVVQLAAGATVKVHGVLDVEAAATPGDLVRSIDPQRLRELDVEQMTSRPMSADPYAATIAIVADLREQMTGQDSNQSPGDG